MDQNAFLGLNEVWCLLQDTLCDGHTKLGCSRHEDDRLKWIEVAYFWMQSEVQEVYIADWADWKGMTRQPTSPGFFFPKCPLRG
jgi:hypothetical protein